MADNQLSATIQVLNIAMQSVACVKTRTCVLPDHAGAVTGVAVDRLHKAVGHDALAHNVLAGMANSNRANPILDVIKPPSKHQRSSGNVNCRTRHRPVGGERRRKSSARGTLMTDPQLYTRTISRDFRVREKEFDFVTVTESEQDFSRAAIHI